MYPDFFNACSESDPAGFFIERKKIMETEPIGNAIGVPTPDENNQVNNNRQNLSAFLFGNSDNSQNGHDTSGHCQKMIHVPAHSREGKPVNAYERICGRDHDEKEAQQKNQADKTRTGLFAPLKDFIRNFNDMNKTNFIGGDKYFHCKANYEAGSRGVYGNLVGLLLSLLKESKDVFKYGPNESLSDMKANISGLRGANKGKTLSESCGIFRPSGLPLKY